ncbi:symmetrical bis(5'-nucleosyl)-tetraphosphatase [Paraglaciecola sp.]|uniref:symmetrical bis(5'-nucleosyl)-tetraphosphatase n=1 Tax=Paraglaciecola sp. TaxID=1920173 RepID=UPI0030F3BC31
MADYIVGDIQGCFDGLKKLLASVSFDPTKDKLIAVGDLVGRGPQSLETLEYLYSLGEQFDTVLGNHDLHLLAIYCGIRQAKPNDKLGKLLADKNIATYIHWLRGKPLALAIDDNTLVSHAGLYPQWSVQQALNLSAECSALLQSTSWQTHLAQMYGNKPDKWQVELSGNERWRFTINAFTRMRYMYDAQKLEFNCKDSPAKAPKNLSPWFEVSNKNLTDNTRLIFGHWATLAGQTNNRQFIALDTGYIWGQQLTMWQVQNNKKYSVSFQD